MLLFPTPFGSLLEIMSEPLLAGDASEDDFDRKELKSCVFERAAYRIARAARKTSLDETASSVMPRSSSADVYIHKPH